MLQYYSIIINKENTLYVAHCPELDVTSQGKSVEEAEDNLREAIELYIESFGIDKLYKHPPLITSIAVNVPDNV